MLHMIVNTHDADNCAFRNEENRGVLLGALDRMDKVATDRGASVEGVWVNMAGHTIFVLVDAPNAHVVDEVVRDAGLVGWTDTRVFTVDLLDTVLSAVADKDTT